MSTLPHSLSESAIQQIQQFRSTANQRTQERVFAEYLERRSHNTLRRHRDGLHRFAWFLLCAAHGIRLDYQDDVERFQPFGEALLRGDGWEIVSYGLVAQFVTFLKEEGFTVATINQRLSTMRVFAELAYRAGKLSDEDHRHIQTLKGYSAREAKNLDQSREVTRHGHKKANNVELTDAQVVTLKRFLDQDGNRLDETPTGRRNKLILVLLLDLGVRVSELVDMRCSDFDWEAQQVTVYRRKTDTTDLMTLTQDVWLALAECAARGELLESDAPLIRASRRGEHLQAAGMSTRSAARIIRELGQKILGVPNLSPHDLRHSWATRAVRGGTGAFELTQAGGWSNMETVKRYVDRNTVANEGVKLSS